MGNLFKKERDSPNWSTHVYCKNKKNFRMQHQMWKRADQNSPKRPWPNQMPLPSRPNTSLIWNLNSERPLRHIRSKSPINDGWSGHSIQLSMQPHVNKNDRPFRLESKSVFINVLTYDKQLIRVWNPIHFPFRPIAKHIQIHPNKGVCLRCSTYQIEISTQLSDRQVFKS